MDIKKDIHQIQPVNMGPAPGGGPGPGGDAWTRARRQTQAWREPVLAVHGPAMGPAGTQTRQWTQAQRGLRPDGDPGPAV